MKDKINSFIWQHFLLLTFFLAFIQTTEAKGQSPCPSYGAYCSTSLLCSQMIW